MNGWETRPLKTFVDPDRSICYGIVQPGARVDTGVPILRVNNFTGTGLDISNAMRVTEGIERDYKRSRLRGGELLVTLVGSLGLTAIAPDELKGWNVARAVGVIPLPTMSTFGGSTSSCEANQRRISSPCAPTPRCRPLLT
jgi:type I restriction enzyme S subunit